MWSNKYTPEQLEVSNWPGVNEDLLKGEDKIDFERKKAILNGYCKEKLKPAEIKRRWGAGRSSIAYFLHRCTALHPDGRVWGYRALLPHTRQADYVRRNVGPMDGQQDGAGRAGMFGWMLDTYTHAKKFLDKRLAPADGQTVKEAGLDLKALHTDLLTVLREKDKVEPSQYPFNTENKGYVSLTKYVKRRLERGDPGVAQALFGDDAFEHLSANSGKQGILRPTSALEILAYDEQKLPFIGTIVVDVHGEEIDVPISRGFLCPLVDCESEAVLGYSVAISRRFRSLDLLTAVERSIVPWARMELTIPGLMYGPEAGLPAGVIPEAKGRRFCLINVDNHLTHSSRAVVDHMRKRTGCAIRFGKVRHWIARAVVEGLFAELQKRGWVRIPSTTGSGPKDPRVNDPVEKARKFKIRMEELLQIIDIVIANHNARVRKKLMAQTCNQRIKKTFRPGSRFTVIPTFSDSFIKDPQIAVEIESRTIRGSRQKSNVPYIELDGESYTNDILRQSWHLIGRDVVLYLRNDYRTVRAYLSDGTDIGVLRVSGYWANHFHTREMRQEINKLVSQGILRGNDPVSAYNRMLNERAAKKGKAKRASVSKEASQIANNRFASGDGLRPAKPQIGDNVVPFDNPKTRGRSSFFGT